MSCLRCQYGPRHDGGPSFSTPLWLIDINSHADGAPQITFFESCGAILRVLARYDAPDGRCHGFLDPMAVKTHGARVERRHETEDPALANLDDLHMLGIASFLGGKPLEALESRLLERVRGVHRIASS